MKYFLSEIKAEQRVSEADNFIVEDFVYHSVMINLLTPKFQSINN